jgi:hypothetical protein
MDMAVSHGVTIFNDHGEFLGKYVKAVVAIPPSATSVELGGVAIELVMHPESVSILAIALASGRVIVVAGVAVQKEMPPRIQTVSPAATTLFALLSEAKGLSFVPAALSLPSVAT